MKNIVVDFDNTMGVHGCDVDDGLALLALLGNPSLCKVVGLTTTYGNSTIEVVHSNTERFIRELEVNIPLYRGAATADEPLSPAARFLANITAEHPGEISILATGSLTNLKGAAQIDPSFFDNVKEIALMGGVLSALTINGRIMDELNFSCDPDATMLALQAPCPVMDAVSQNCLPCFFTKDELLGRFGSSSWLIEACNNWFSTMDEKYEWNGFTVWDLVAAIYLIRPDLFEDDWQEVTLYRRWLQVGLLETQHMEGAPVSAINLPRIKDIEGFKSFALGSWACVLEPLGLA